MAPVSKDTIAIRLNRLRQLLAEPDSHVHLVGICGVGMAGLACHLRRLGMRVSGCDAAPNRLADWLRQQDITVHASHDPRHLAAGVDWLVRSSAVSESGEEPTAARANGIPMFRRGEVLAVLTARTFSVAVSGTHGKTTTSCFIADMLRRCGRAVGWCIGGETGGPDALCVAGFQDGVEDPVLVVEADESDGTAALYTPDIAVVNNIEFDHMEHFASVEAFESCFARLAGAATQAVITGGDDARAARICGALPGAVSFGFAAGVQLRAVDLEEEDGSISFMVEREGQCLGRLALPVPGRHNALNALAALGVGFALGLDFERMRDALGSARLPRRRFELLAERDDVAVISDYAHHPTEITAFVSAAKRLPHARRVAVFQPHRFTRTLVLGPDFPAAFEGIDELILTPVYAASEEPLAGGTVWDLYARFRAQVDSGTGVPRVRVAASLEEAWWYLRRTVRGGDALLVIGAGDVEKIGEWAGAALRTGAFRFQHPDGEARQVECRDGFTDGAALEERLAASRVRYAEPLASKTTLGVGGRADAWVDIGSESDLAALLRWAHDEGVPVHLLGAGSNVLASDLGVGGVVARLTGEAFRAIRDADGAIVAGAAAPLGRLVEWAATRGFAGLEFLDGIPGTVGGALRMNAGAWCREIVEQVLWIRCLNADGSTCIVGRSDLMAGYRQCGALVDRVAVEAAFRCWRGDPPDIAERCRVVRARREWLRGMRSAGSVFRNPQGRSAGRMLDAAGMRGMRVGGARVSERHANVIVTEDGCCASDVRSLLELGRAAVRRQFGVELEAEVVVLGAWCLVLGA